MPLFEDLQTAIIAEDTEAIQELSQQAFAHSPTSWAERFPGRLSPILLALYHQKPKLAEILATASGRLDLFEAAALGEHGQVQTLLEASPAEVDSLGVDGFTPLHLACFFAHPSVVHLLLERGAEVAAVAQNPSQVQPLHSAVAGRSLECVRSLLESGAPVGAAQRGGWTPLHAAIKNGLPEIAQLLVEAGADMRQEAEDGTTPRSFAFHSEDPEILEFLDPDGDQSKESEEQ